MGPISPIGPIRLLVIALLESKAGPRNPLDPALVKSPLSKLKHVADSHNDSAVTTISIPLVKESRSSNRRVWSTEVPGVGEIKEVSTDLQSLIFTNPGVLK